MIYRTQMHRVLKRNFELFPVLGWIAAVTAHVSCAQFRIRRTRRLADEESESISYTFAPKERVSSSTTLTPAGVGLLCFHLTHSTRRVP